MLIKEMPSNEKLKALLELFNEGKSLAEITAIAGYQKKSNVKDFLKGKGYQFDGDNIINLHIAGQSDDIHVTQTNKIKAVPVVKHETDNLLLKELQSRELQRDLIALAKQYDEIQEALIKIKSLDMHMTDNRSEVITVVQEGIKIDLPTYEGKAYRASIRINPVIWEEFDKFSAQYPEFDKAALIAQAMKEYMEKHK